jgi:hypothetical protein
VRAKPKQPAAPDLFGNFGSGQAKMETRPEPDPRASAAPKTATPPHSRAIQECRVEGSDYRIEKHTDSEGTFWRLFIQDGNKWRRLWLSGGDAQYIPDMVLYHAEQMLDWSAGYTDRTRDLVPKLRPTQKDIDIPFPSEGS